MLPTKARETVYQLAVFKLIVRLICENDLAIRNFVQQTYWKLQLEDKENEVIFTNKDKFTDSDEVLELSGRHFDVVR